MAETEKPDWVKPGVKVLVYSSAGKRSANLVRTTIARVAAKSFTVAAEREPRFKLPCCSAQQGDTWSLWTRYVVPWDSDTARKELRKYAEREQLHTAQDALNAWLKNHTYENKIAAIAALQAVTNDEVVL